MTKRQRKKTWTRNLATEFLRKLGLPERLWKRVTMTLESGHPYEEFCHCAACEKARERPMGTTWDLAEPGADRTVTWEQTNRLEDAT